MIKIDNPAWYYLKEANNGLYDLLEFLSSSSISDNELENLGINEEQKNNINEYYKYISHSLTNLRQAVLNEIKNNIESKSGKIKVEKIKNDTDDESESLCTITFNFNNQGVIEIYTGLYCAKDININGKPVECPTLSVAFYNGDDKKKIFNKKIEELKESTENKLDFYNKHKEIYITSLDIEIKNQEDFEKACERVIKFADDKIQQIINTLAKTK